MEQLTIEEQIREKLISKDCGDLQPERVGDILTELVLIIANEGEDIRETLKNIDALRHAYETHIKQLVANAAVKTYTVESYLPPDELRARHKDLLLMFRFQFHFASMLEAIGRRAGDKGEPFIFDESYLATGSSEYNSAFEEFLIVAEENDRIVKQLTMAAEKNGLESALSDSEFSAAIKVIFNSPSEYRDFLEKCIESALTYRINEVYLLAGALGENGKSLGELTKLFENEIRVDSAKLIRCANDRKIQAAYGVNRII